VFKCKPKRKLKEPLTVPKALSTAAILVGVVLVKVA
jgi:hypothetical protein